MYLKVTISALLYDNDKIKSIEYSVEQMMIIFQFNFSWLGQADAHKAFPIDVP